MVCRQSQTTVLILFCRRRHHPKSMVLDLSGSSTPWKILPSGNFLQVEFAIVPAFHSDVDHVGRPDLMFASSISHDVQPFQSFVDGHVTERQSTTRSSAKRYAQLCLPIVLGDQERVKCTWPGCMSILKKDGHTRHVENIHLRKVKAICPRCPRATHPKRKR